MTTRTFTLTICDQTQLVNFLFDSEEITYDDIENHMVDEESEYVEEEDRLVDIYAWKLITEHNVDFARKIGLPIISYGNNWWVGQIWWGVKFERSTYAQNLLKELKREGKNFNKVRL